MQNWKWSPATQIGVLLVVLAGGAVAVFRFAPGKDGAPLPSLGVVGAASTGVSEVALEQAPERVRPPAAAARDLAEEPVVAPLRYQEGSEITPDSQLSGLLKLEDWYRNAPPQGKDAAAFNLTTYSVAVILRWQGRADFGSPEERARLNGGMSLRPETENQWVFGSDDARFRFEKGEFPIYDTVQERYRLRMEGNPVQTSRESIDKDVDAILQEAVMRLESSR